MAFFHTAERSYNLDGVQEIQWGEGEARLVFLIGDEPVVIRGDDLERLRVATGYDKAE